MSGSSSGGWVSPSSENDDCAGLVFNTNLASPQANVIADLEEGDMLNIRAAREQGPIQAFDEHDRLAGNIISSYQVRLLNCINQGNEYVGEVLEIQGGQCSIQVRSL